MSYKSGGKRPLSTAYQQPLRCMGPKVSRSLTKSAEAAASQSSDSEAISANGKGRAWLQGIPGSLKPAILGADRRYRSFFAPLRVLEGPRRPYGTKNLRRFTTPVSVIASARGFTRDFESQRDPLKSSAQRRRGTRSGQRCAARGCRLAGAHQVPNVCTACPQTAHSPTGRRPLTTLVPSAETFAVLCRT